MRAWYELETNPTAMGYGGAGTTLGTAQRTRESAAALLGCAPEEIVITRSTTDGMNAVAQGLRLPAGSRILLDDNEHPGGRSGWEYLAAKQGAVLDDIRIPIGENDPQAVLDRYARAITPATRVLVVSHILSSTGFRMPIAEIAQLARSRNVLCVVDGAQAAGNIAVDVKSLGCHAYVTSGHKWLMGPKGTGVLYLAPDAPVEPIQCFENRTVYSESSGVQNVPGIIGLGVAIEAARATGIGVIEQHNLELRNRLYAGLRRIPAIEVMSAPPGPLASPLVSFRLPARLESRAMGLRLLNEHRVMVKVVPTNWMNGLRLSPHIFNTADECDRALEALRRAMT